MISDPPVTLAGDGRFDSPGHSARYCSYTFIDTVGFYEFVQFQVRSEEHTSELQSPVPISYAVFCLKKKKKINIEGESILQDTNKHIQHEEANR